MKNMWFYDSLYGFVYKKRGKAGTCLLLFICTFIFLLNSPLNIWTHAEAYTDSSVFKTVAYMMDKGYMPYRDSFDHKGPLVYLLNLAGMKIAAYRGIWILEFITVYFTFLLIYKIAGLCCERIYAIISMLLSVSLLWGYYEGGNLVEEYAMPFIAVSLYIYLDYLIYSRINVIRLIFCGFSFGAVCLLRPNMISVWVVFSLSVAVRLVVKRQSENIWYFLIYFLMGTGIIVMPVIIWLIVNHSFYEFIECYFQFNMLYSSGQSAGATLGAKWNAFFYFANSMPVLISAAACIYLYRKKDRFIYGVYLIYLICTLIFLCVSGQTFGHYGMILVPAAAFPAASLIENGFSYDKKSGLPVYLAFYLLVIIVLPDWMSAAGRVMSSYENRMEDQRSDLVKSVCGIVVDNTTEEDKISVYGNWNIIYLMSSRMHATRYSYQFPTGLIMPELMDDYFRQLGTELPVIIVVASGCMNERMEHFLHQYDYNEIYSLDNTIIYKKF